MVYNKFKFINDSPGIIYGRVDYNVFNLLKSRKIVPPPVSWYLRKYEAEMIDQPS